MTCREHFLRSFRYSLKSIWILIFPLLNTVLSFNFNSTEIYSWFRDTWLYILAVTVMIAFGTIRRYKSCIKVTDNSITHTQGLFIRIEKTIPFEKLSTVTYESPFYLVPFKAVNLRFDTRAGFLKATDMKFQVSKKDAEEIMKRFPKSHQKKENPFPKTRILDIILYSFFFSSGFSAVIYLSAFFINGGAITSDIMEIAIPGITAQADHIYSMLLNKIPKYTVLGAVLLIGAWLFSFILNVLRYSHFNLNVNKDSYSLSFGTLKKRKYLIKTKNENYIYIKQNLIMRLNRRMTVNINCPGYGISSHQPILIPMTDQNSLKKMDINLDISKSRKLRPEKFSFLSYTGMPLLGIAAVTIIYRFVSIVDIINFFSDILSVIYNITDFVSIHISFPNILPLLSNLSAFLSIMAYIPLFWLVVVKYCDYSSAGIFINEKNQVLISCSKGTTFHTAIVNPENIKIIMLKKPELFKRASVTLWLSGESSSQYTVRGLSYSEAEEFIEKLYILKNSKQ